MNDWHTPFRIASDLILGGVGWLIVLVIIYFLVGLAVSLLKGLFSPLAKLLKKKDITPEIAPQDPPRLRGL